MTRGPADNLPRRRGRLKRFLKWLGLGTSALLFILAALIAWVVGTRSGTEFAWQRVQGFLPPSIQVAGVKGRLIGPLTLTGVTIDSESMHLSVDEIHLRWVASDLLRIQLHVQQLAIHGVDYRARPGRNRNQPRSTEAAVQLPESVNLPVSVRIDKIAVDNVAVRGASRAEPFRIAKAHVRGVRLNTERWQIGQLSAHGPRFQLHASARLTPKNGYPLHLEAKAHYEPSALAPINAKAAIDGKLHALAIEASVQAPYNLTLNGNVRNALDKPRLALTVHANKLRAHAIKPSLPKLVASAGVDVKGQLNDLAIAVDASVESADYGTADLAGRLHYTPEAVAIKKFRITSPRAAGQLNAHGLVRLADEIQLDITTAWSDLQWPLKGKPKYRTKSGRVHLTGTLDDYELTGKLGWQVVGRTQGQLRLAGHGSRSAFTLTRFKLTGGAGVISGHAEARWAPSLKVSAEFAGRNIKPGAVVPGVSGDFDFHLTATARRDKSGLVARIDTLTANGKLNDHPVDLDAALAYAGTSIRVDHLRLDSGSAQARLSGRFGWQPGSKLDLQFKIEAPELAAFWPTLAGSLHAEGRLAGTLTQPAVKLALDARHLQYGDYQLGRATIDADIDWSGAAQSTLNVELAGVAVAGRHLKRLTLNAEGTPATHHVELSFNGAGADLDATLTGHYQRQAKRWRFQLNGFDAKYGKFAAWHLAGSAGGVVDADHQKLEQLCLRSGQARICVTGKHSAASGSRAQIEIADLAFGYLKPILPKTVSVSGTVSGSLHARLPVQGAPALNAHLTTSTGRVQVQTTQGETVNVLQLKPGQIDATLENRRLAMKIDLPLAEGGVHARARIAAGDRNLIHRPLTGRLRVKLADLGFISRFSPQIGTVKGRVTGDMRLTGRIAEPVLHGRLELALPKLGIPRAGITLTNTRITAIGQGNRIAIEGQLKSGGGTLRLDGQVGLGGAGQSVVLTIQGEDFQVVKIPSVHAWVSPDLKLALTPERIEVTGKLTIPKAQVTPRNLPAAGAVTVSSDQVIVGKEQSTAEKVARAVYADIQLILGDQVHIEGFGLKTDATGRVHIVQKPGQPAIGSGRINLVHGSYRAYGQNLDIVEGHILFGGGPISEPAINLKAARYPREDITVGVHVRGPVTHPNVTLFSEPPMTQTAQLSWLLLGRPPGETTAGQSSLIAKAALALGSGRANSVLNMLGEQLGVDKIGIGSAAGKSASTAAFRIGKYLTPKLYVQYGIGVFEPVSTVTVKYFLSSHWTLKTESSSQATGGDIVFSIDQ